MLVALRKYTGSFLVKVILGLLVLSFAAWGINDVSFFRAENLPVATIGETEVDRSEVELEINREIARLAPQFGNRLDINTARLLGIPQAVFGRVINEKVLNLEAGDLDLRASDKLVRDEVRASPAFQSELGGFDRFRFEQVLQQNGYTENAYIERIRDEIIRAQLLDSLEAGVQAPAPLTDLLFRHREEQRVIESLFLPDTAIIVPEKPTDAALRTYHKTHERQFMSPEYRAISLILIRSADLIGEQTADDAQLRDAFDARSSDFTVEEKRTAAQMILDSKEAADKAHARLTAGDDFLTVARQDAGMEEDATALGTLVRGDVLPELADALFSLEKDAFSAPVESPLGWHIVRVSEIEEGHQATFEEVKEDLAKTIAQEKAIDTMFELANGLEEEVGRGATLEEAAADLGLTVHKIEGIDARGQTPEGKRPAVVTTDQNAAIIAGGVFETEEGTDSTLRELGNDAFFIARVDGITASAVRPFEDAKNDVEVAWTAEERRKIAKKNADDFISKLTSGEELAALAVASGGEVATSNPVKRYYTDAVSGLPRAVLIRTFATNKGDAAAVRVADGYHVIKIKDVIDADPATGQEAKTALNAELVSILQADLITQLAGALRNDAGVSVNEQVFNRIIDPLAGGPGLGH